MNRIQPGIAMSCRIVLSLILSLMFRFASAQTPNYPSLFVANQNTTGGVQTPLSLGNWNGSMTTVPSFQYNTSDDGTSHLEIHGTRWGSAISWTRSDPNPGSYNLMQLWGINGGGATLSLFNGSNQTTIQLNGLGTTYFTGGNVLIGKTSQTNSGYILDINGNVRANQVVVNTSGADFVFDPGYHLPNLKVVESYVRQEHHLPDIAPAAQMQKEGIDLGANQTRLLQKIEELTLYTIQQDKEIDSLKDKVRRLETQNNLMGSLLKRIEQLEQREHSH